MLNPKLVWVEIGRSLPRYLLRNMKLTSKLFPNIEQLIVSEGKIWTFENGRRVSFRGEYPISERTKNFYELKRNFANRDSEFWQETTGRFFHLADAMKSVGIEKFFHMESDVVLLDQKAISQVFNSNERDFLAFPMQSSEVGCASVLIVNGEDSLKSFLDLVLSRWEEDGTTDMTLLGEFTRDSNTKKFYLSLPTILESKSLQVEYVWDAGAIGPYFLGGDARNRRIPFIRRGVLSSVEWTHKIKEVSWFKGPKYHLRRDASRMISCTGTFGTRYLANIHIHSKRVPSSPRKLRQMISRGFAPKRHRLWVYAGIDWVVVLERTLDFTRRRILRLNRRVINCR